MNPSAVLISLFPVQNADDAGATSVAIVLDRERYGASSILSPRMAAWQGPALLCYNDAQFTPRDLHNISRIGQDSKLEKPAAIGRFGLGFNSGGFEISRVSVLKCCPLRSEKFRDFDSEWSISKVGAV